MTDLTSGDIWVSKKKDAATGTQKPPTTGPVFINDILTQRNGQPTLLALWAEWSAVHQRADKP